eukprot:5226231-Prymnesium_polylepis.1
MEEEDGVEDEDVAPAGDEAAAMEEEAAQRDAAAMAGGEAGNSQDDGMATRRGRATSHHHHDLNSSDGDPESDIDNADVIQEELAGESSGPPANGMGDVAAQADGSSGAFWNHGPPLPLPQLTEQDQERCGQHPPTEHE